MAAIPQKDAGTSFLLAGELVEHLSHWHLLPYALRNLATHLNHLGMKSPEMLGEFENFIMQIGKKPTSYSALLLSLWVQSQPWPKHLGIPTKPYVAQECLDTTLNHAAAGGQTNAVDILLILGASADRALYTASEHGYIKIVEILFNGGADVNARGGKYGNALQAASTKGHGELARFLLYKGADVNARGGEYATSLQAASKKGHQNIVQLLLDKGADVNAQGGKYGTALQAASTKGHQDLVRVLLERGADPRPGGEEDSIPIDDQSTEL